MGEKPHLVNRSSRNGADGDVSSVTEGRFSSSQGSPEEPSQEPVEIRVEDAAGGFAEKPAEESRSIKQNRRKGRARRKKPLWFRIARACVIVVVAAAVVYGNIHGDPELAYFIGDESFWTGTDYEDLSLQQVGDFKYQYGQHSVEFDGTDETTGGYYLLMFDNNYWANSTRDDFAPDMDGTDVSTDLYSGEAS